MIICQVALFWNACTCRHGMIRPHTHTCGHTGELYRPPRTQIWRTPLVTGLHAQDMLDAITRTAIVSPVAVLPRVVCSFRKRCCCRLPAAACFGHDALQRLRSHIRACTSQRVWTRHPPTQQFKFPPSRHARVCTGSSAMLSSCDMWIA